jgi:hypothetical protein
MPRRNPPALRPASNRTCGRATWRAFAVWSTGLTKSLQPVYVKADATSMLGFHFGDKLTAFR